jgi:putative nucleotidyltransferase with HDIG domain
MPASRLQISCPELLSAFARSPLLGTAIRTLGDLALAEVDLETAGNPTKQTQGAQAVPIQYRGRIHGHVCYCPAICGPVVPRAAHAIASLMEHALEREMAVADLAAAVTADYEELNMLYDLTSKIVTRTYAPDIGEIVVQEAVRILKCRRVSLLVLDDRQNSLSVLASRGLPAEALHASVPLTGTIAGQVLLDEDMLLVNDLADRPDLEGRSRGSYQTESFLVVRVPLFARGEAVGVLTATERDDGSEFTSRDRRLAEGLSSLAASALLNCRLHATVQRQMLGTIRALASAVDAKDPYTKAHSARVAELSVQSARRLGLAGERECREVELAGLLHDVGKIGISDAILRKPDRLTWAEYEIIKGHPKIGARIVEQVQGLEEVAKAVLHHHERYDGLGYPAGLSGAAIPLTSRLIAASDTFDALTSERPYRPAMSTSDALREIQLNSGTQLAPDAVEALVEALSRTDADHCDSSTRQSPDALASCP